MLKCSHYVWRVVMVTHPRSSDGDPPQLLSHAQAEQLLGPVHQLGEDRHDLPLPLLACYWLLPSTLFHDGEYCGSMHAN